MKRTTTYAFPRLAPAALPLIAALVCLTGCVKGSLLDPDGPLADGKIRISSAIAATTKAPALDTSALDGVRFLRRDVTGNTAPNEYAGITAIGGNRLANGNIVFDEEQGYTYSDYHVFFVAYWPAGTETAGTKADWTIDGKTDILVADEYNAGTNNAPLTGEGGAKGTPMTFQHQLAQLEVVCKADPDATEAATRLTWGKIQKIELLDALPAAEYSYSTNRVTFGGTKGAIALSQRDYQTAFGAIDVPGSTNTAVTAAGMFAPSTGALKLRVTSQTLGTMDITTRLQDGGADKNLDAGLKHTVTLTFKASKMEIVAQTTKIEPWGTGNKADDGNVTPPPPPGIWVNGAPLATTNRNGMFLFTAYTVPPGTDVSYNGKAPGTYYATIKNLLDGEPPFRAFEVAQEDESPNLTWLNARAACANKTTNGGGWRLPRMSELMLMYLNRAELAASGFALVSNIYWSDTEGSATTSWRLAPGDGSHGDANKTLIDQTARCVREIK